MDKKGIEFVNAIEKEIAEYRKEREEEFSYIAHKFLCEDLCDSSAKMEEDNAEAEHQAQLGRLCCICADRGVSESNLIRLFGEDYERYL